MALRRVPGFTLIELIVVILIIGILIAFAIPSYLRSVETSKADDAAAAVRMIGTTNRMFALDHANSYASGTLTTGGACSGPSIPAITNCPAAGPYTGCHLVGCGYLAAQDWNAKPYTLAAADGAASAACLGLTAGTYVACAVRKTTGVGSTSIAPYNGWGYTMNVSGQMTPYPTGADVAPTPVE